MRILISGQIYADSFARNIAVSAEGMGHKVITVDPRRLRRHLGYAGTILSEYLRKALATLEVCWHRPLVRAAQDFQPDLILIAHGELPPGVIRQLRPASRARIVAWFPDSIGSLRRQYLLGADLDGWFFKDPYMVDEFRTKLGLNAFYLPEACNPRWHRRVELTDADRQKYGCDLTSACSMYYYRARILEMFMNYDLKLWGSGFPFWLNSPLRARYANQFVAELEKAKAFNAARVVLNTMFPGEIESVNCRVFEAAGCGAFQIADSKPVLPELFEPEREIVTFRSRDELRDKVDYYLSHSEERRAIANRACERAHREHTYERRLRQIFEKIGLARVVAGSRNPQNERAKALVGSD